jgi:hypothetical protein
MTILADDGTVAAINIQHKSHDNHFELPVPADQPAVYLDIQAQQIIIEGNGCASYYDVEITALSTFDVPISTRVNGNNAVIDISSLPSDDYVIDIDTPMGNSFQGDFTIN